jgi:hypothetical protein
MVVFSHSSFALGSANNVAEKSSNGNKNNVFMAFLKRVKQSSILILRELAKNK